MLAGDALADADALGEALADVVEVCLVVASPPVAFPVVVLVAEPPVPAPPVAVLPVVDASTFACGIILALSVRLMLLPEVSPVAVADRPVPAPPVALPPVVVLVAAPPVVVAFCPLLGLLLALGLEVCATA